MDDMQLAMSSFCKKNPKSNARTPLYKPRASSFSSIADVFRAGMERERESSSGANETNQGSDAKGEHTLASFLRKPKRPKDTEEFTDRSPSFQHAPSTRPSHSSFTEDETVHLTREDSESYSQVFISPAGDWTRALSDAIKCWTTNGTWIAPCWVQGPFLSPFSSAVSYGRLMIVASGIGLSAALPVAQQLNECEREVFIVWISRSLEQVSLPPLSYQID